MDYTQVLRKQDREDIQEDLMPKKLERCVKKVKAQNKKSGKKVNPYAVCVSSTGQKPHKRKKKKGK